MISGEVQKRDLKIIDKSCTSRQFLKWWSDYFGDAILASTPDWVKICSEKIELRSPRFNSWYIMGGMESTLAAYKITMSFVQNTIIKFEIK